MRFCTFNLSENRNGNLNGNTRVVQCKYLKTHHLSTYTFPHWQIVLNIEVL